MNQLKPKKIEEYIIDILKLGPISNLDLISKIKKIRPNTTKQAVYLALRVLKEGGQVISYKGMSSLDTTWLNKMIRYFIGAKSNYVKDSISENNFLNLEPGESVNYFFNNIIKADHFWTHAIYLILEKIDSKEPVYLYNPHEWFILLRNENELELIEEVKKKRQIFFAVTGKCFLDKYVKKFFKDDLGQYHILDKPLFKKNNYYFNIMGDFLIEVWMDEKMCDKMDIFYKNNKIWNEEEKDKLEKIFSTEKKLRLKISNNPRKTERIKKSLKKYFYIPKKSLI